MFFVVSSEELPSCPVCNGTLRYRDSRLRICKKEGGIVTRLMIRRLKCTQCHTYHNELPDCLAPYKHYESEVISGVLDEVVSPDDDDSEDFPSFQTMLRWLRWFQMNLANIEGYLRNIRLHALPGIGKELLTESLLDTTRKTYQNWLEIILRIIYNSGGFLPALPG